MNDPLPPLREVIKGLGLSAKKSLGQNFLLDLNITRKIARAIPAISTANVLEIGPGPGGLTRGLLIEGAKAVMAVEKDERCRQALEDIKQAYEGRFSYHMSDALDLDETSVFPGQDYHIAANLPYNIASPLLVKWLSAQPWPPRYKSITVMLQKEVALRLVAEPNSKVFGRLSVLAQWRGAPKILFHVPPEAFTPKPKVTSTVIQILPGPAAVEGLEAKTLGAFTQKLFGQRRKTLRNVLSGLGDVEGVLEAENIAPTLRPENLSVGQICRLAKAFN